MKTEGKWIIFNPGEDLMFAECSRCGYEENDQVFLSLMTDADDCVTRCPRCHAKIQRYEIAEEEIHGQ